MAPTRQHDRLQSFQSHFRELGFVEDTAGDAFGFECGNDGLRASVPNARIGPYTGIFALSGRRGPADPELNPWTPRYANSGQLWRLSGGRWTFNKG